jgi:1-acyl-sn-glycerol-3-phosphate acyltransferase
MILKSKHHFFYYSIFRFFWVKWVIRRNFYSQIISGNFCEKKLPVLIIANHISWWDGIWVMYLNLKLMNRKFHFMMLEEQLKKFKHCYYVGGYSVKKKSKSIIESLNYTIDLLSDKKNMVLLFPQGEIQSLYQPDVKFEKGIDHILKKVGDKIQVLFVANLVDYFSNPKPSIFTYLKEYSNLNFEPGKVEKEFNLFYAECITQNNQKQDA